MIVSKYVGRLAPEPKKLSEKYAKKAVISAIHFSYCLPIIFPSKITLFFQCSITAASTLFVLWRNFNQYDLHDLIFKYR